MKSSLATKGFMAVGLILVIILSGSYFFILNEIKSIISDKLVQEMNATPAPDVKINTSPFGLVSGRIDELRIAARTVNLDGLMLNDLNISVTGIDVDLFGSLNGELIVEKIGKTNVDFVATENGINNAVPVFAEIALKDEKVIVVLSLLGKDTRIQGTILVGESELEFISDDPNKAVMVQVHGEPLKIPNEFELEKDIVLKVDRVEIHNGFLKVFASIK